MGSLLVVTGPPGAGKSTVSSALADLPERSMLVRGDAFFDFVAAGFIEPWLAESKEQNEAVTRAAGAATGELAEAYDTIYDGVLGAWLLPTFLAAARIDEVDYVMLLPDLDACLGRIRTRRHHSFTDQDAGAHMHREFSNATIGRQHVLDTTDLDPAQTVERIVELRASGALRLP